MIEEPENARRGMIQAVILGTVGVGCVLWASASLVIIPLDTIRRAVRRRRTS